MKKYLNGLNGIILKRMKQRYFQVKNCHKYYVTGCFVSSFVRDRNCLKTSSYLHSYWIKLY